MADLRKCIGSTRFGIEAHEAPVADFPVQPSQKDGLGRMCKPHWNQYTSALRKVALARTAAEAPVTPTTDVPGAKPAVSTSKSRAPKPAAATARKAKAVTEITSDAPPPVVEA